MPEYIFDHVHLMSPDPGKTAEFYQKSFGATLVAKVTLGDIGQMYNLKLGGVTFLISPSTDGTSGLSHFGIRTDDLDKAVAGLKGDSVKFTREITRVNPNFRISFLEAPEKVDIELQEGTV